MELSWQAPNRADLAAAIDGGRLPHALLLSAYPGWGATELAAWLALRLLQRSDGSDARQLAHPDFRWVAPEKGRISVDEIRRLREFGQGTPQMAGAKAAVIEEADCMNVNAANALLKTLEEPPGDTYLILCSHRAGSLPPTIRSRCSTVAIARDLPAAQAWLAGRKALELLPDYDGAPLSASIGAADGERPIAGLLAELGGANGERAAQLLEELLGLDPLRLAARWLRCLVRIAAGTSLTEGADAPTGAASLPALPADRRLFAFVDELLWFHRQVSLSNSVNLRLETERLCHCWRELVRQGAGRRS